jgi:maltooligosyltrehalose trehalohydrolase
MKRSHRMPFGAQLDAQGGAAFRLWAPQAQRVDLVRLDGRDAGEFAMRTEADGWFELTSARAQAGERYGFRIDGGLFVPDPASRSNPEGVHAASALVDPRAFDWPDATWHGRPWHEAVIYELHVGCFTPEGTFNAAIDRLDDLVALGATAIELMPVAAFAGRRGWGYDGVLAFAPQASYGTPEDLKALVAQAHCRGMMVLLDVVYNHFGPDGNYLHAYARPFFNCQVKTPWGAAINFDAASSRTVRDFFIHNALYWTNEFNVDGLRLDAVHAIHDRSRTHFVEELAQTLRAGPGRERPVHVIVENDANDARRLRSPGSYAAQLADAQWNDDVHHALHVIVTGETDGYYADFAQQPLHLFGRALAEGFAYQGEASPYRGGERRGTPSAQLAPTAFVNALQTHDQVGNRALGERIGVLAAARGHTDALRALAACVMLAPSPPLLFMGEEYAASTPFLYFCDFEGELARVLTLGRRAEFARFARFAEPAWRESIPDPNAPSTFIRSKLDWSERDRRPHAGWLAWTTAVLRCRHARLLPWLDGARSGEFTQPAPGTLRVCWPLAAGRRWHLLAQLADHDGAGRLATAPPGERVYASHDVTDNLPAWSVQVTIEEP